jgi:hypothetical protein
MEGHLEAADSAPLVLELAAGNVEVLLVLVGKG